MSDVKIQEELMKVAIFYGSYGLRKIKGGITRSSFQLLF